MHVSIQTESKTSVSTRQIRSPRSLRTKQIVWRWVGARRVRSRLIPPHGAHVKGLTATDFSHHLSLLTPQLLCPKQCSATLFPLHYTPQLNQERRPPRCITKMDDPAHKHLGAIFTVVLAIAILVGSIWIIITTSLSLKRLIKAQKAAALARRDSVETRGTEVEAEELSKGGARRLRKVLVICLMSADGLVACVFLSP